MLDIRLRPIVSKAAGVYFIVTDNSTIAEIEADPKLRLFFINVPDGPYNNVVKFAKGDTDSFTATFGKPTRTMEKNGNFSHSVCLDALQAGPIAVVNLRKLTTAQKSDINYVSLVESDLDNNMTTNTSDIYDKNGFWVAKAENVTAAAVNNPQGGIHRLFNITNIGVSPKSIFVVRSTDEEVAQLTSEGDKTLLETSLEIENFTGLNVNMPLRDTFITVYIFNSDFTNPINHPKYGNLFKAHTHQVASMPEYNTHIITRDNLSKLAAIPESGFVTKYVGTTLPDMKNEDGDLISIDDIMYRNFITTGVVSHINYNLLDSQASNALDGAGRYINKLLEYIAKDPNTDLDFGVNMSIPKIPALRYVNNKGFVIIDNTTSDTTTQASELFAGSILGHNYKTISQDGMTLTFAGRLVIPRVSTAVYGHNNTLAKIISVEHVAQGSGYNTVVKLEAPALISKTFSLYDSVTSQVKEYRNVAWFVPREFDTCPIILRGVPVQANQFLDGTVSKQNEILDMINSKSIIKGLKGIPEIRYIVDTFKSHVVTEYKKQFGELMETMHENNKFITCIVNEPFISDLVKSQDPLFRESLTDSSIDYSLLPIGGHQQLTSKFMSKYDRGADKTFFVGPEKIVDNRVRPISGIISNLMYQKVNEFDIVANTTGYLSGIESLAEYFDDNDRAHLEKFRYNPVVKDENGRFTLYGNLSGQKKLSKLTQWHNVELLCYIKRNLNNIGKYDTFKKGTYDEYLRTQTEVQDFMDSLVLAGAIKPNPTVICDTTNNTPEVASYKIKLIKVSYVPYDSLEKVVFDIHVNKD